LITPSANNRYQFTGVKGGALEVDSILSGTNALVIGLANPIEANGSVSSVTLGGVNTFSGGTTLNSGILNVLTDTALGTSVVSVPDTGSITAAPIISAPQSPVTLSNAISFGNLNGGNAPGLTLGRPNDSANLTLAGILSDQGEAGFLAIQGNVTLSGDNTYSGNTLFNGVGNPNPTLTLGSSTALGTGSLTIQTEGTLLAGAASVTVNNSIILNQPLTIGAGGNTNTLILNGDLSGGKPLTILSPVEIPNANPSLSGEVFIQDTMVTIGNELSLGTGQLSTTNATVVLGIPDPTIDNLTGDSTSVISLESEATLTLYTPNTLEEFDGTITGDSSNSVVKTGAGTEYLTGTSTYADGTDINQGTIVAGSAGALGPGTISVNSGAVIGTSAGVTLTNTLDLAGSSTVGGIGTFAPPGGVTLSSGITASPGNPALGSGYGTLSFATGLTLGTSGAYNFNIGNAGGSAGTDYSTLNVTGGLTITATMGSPFTINVGSIDPGTNQPGLATFNPALPYSWTLVSADSITGFSTTKFAFSTSGFQNAGLSGSNLSIVQTGNDLVLDFTPVPEPSTWALVAAGILAVGLVVRRRRVA
jgi:autotransporter-associated beta strand protein